MTDDRYVGQSGDLTKLLGLAAPPIAITFTREPVPGVQPFDAPMPEPTSDGRTGRVSAGCVFWMHAVDRTFTTVPDDHRNCSVGMLTHGLHDLPTAATREDVKTIIDVGWVTAEAAAQIPAVREQFPFITYGPLASTSVDPDVVLLRINARGLMILMDTFPGLRVEGKPQCHIVPVAREQSEVAVSAGCALSRARTGMSASEMTCAIPGSQLDAVIGALEKTTGIDTSVAQYAAADARRFNQQARASG
jgi:uncharacterized protein (DUF169 family)